MKRFVCSALVVVAAALFSPAAGAEESVDNATQTQLDAYVTKNTAGAKKVKTITGSLDAPDSSKINVKKGFCYTFVLRLGKGASLTASPSIDFDEWPMSSDAPSRLSAGSDFAGPTGAVIKPDCATASQSVSMWFAFESPSGFKPRGKGPYTIDVYERAASTKQLKNEAAAAKKAHAENVRETQAARAKTCGQCASPVSGRKVCLERRGVTMADCGW